jgi:integrase/recombinase XerD
MLLKFAIQEFLADREFKNLTKNSLTTSNYYLTEMKESFNNLGILNVEAISLGLVKQYLVYCKNTRGNNPTTINSKIKRLKAIFNFMIESRILKENPFETFKLVKEDIKIES